MRVVLALLLVAGAASAQIRPRSAPPPAIITGPSWVTTQCWVEPRWFETLRSGPVDYCKRSLRFRPGQVDCLAFTDEVCWAVNRDTGEWTQLRNSGRETLFVCPSGPEPPTCPRLR
jgi:hypothetical protein